MKLITNKEQSKEAAIFLLNKRYGNLKEYHTEEFPYKVFYYIPENKEIVMEHDIITEELWVDYVKIISYLKILFGYYYSEAKEVIGIWAEETYNLKGVIPKTMLYPSLNLMNTTEKPTNL